MGSVPATQSRSRASLAPGPLKATWRTCCGEAASKAAALAPGPLKATWRRCCGEAAAKAAGRLATEPLKSKVHPPHGPNASCGAPEALPQPIVQHFHC